MSFRKNQKRDKKVYPFYSEYNFNSSAAGYGLTKVQNRLNYPVINRNFKNLKTTQVN